MSKLGFDSQKVFMFSKYSIIPASLLGMFWIYFLSLSDFTNEAGQGLQTVLIIISLITILFSAYFHILNTVISVSLILISYLLINNMRMLYGEDFMFSSGYNIWTMLLFPNLLLAFFVFNKYKIYRHWNLVYIFIFLQTWVIEKLQTQNINADSYYFYSHVGMLNYPTIFLASICLLIMFINYIQKGRMLCISSLCSFVSVLIGIYYSDNIFAFNLFLLSAVIIQGIVAMLYLQYIRHKDEELDMANYHTFFAEAENKYPLKYSIALMCLDDYPRLQKRFGRRKMILLKKMFLTRIKQTNENVLVYNYKDDALILAFINANITESFEKAEEIRRALVKSVFVFNENNHLQLTVSQCVCEKKRSDANAEVVLLRAEENLFKACKFTRNITIKA